MSNIPGAKIVLVCTDCDNTRILFHGIKSEIPISTIIVEQPVSRKVLIKRRIKRLGLIKVFGQLLFQAGVVPVMRRLSSGKVKQLLHSRNLSLEPLPSTITRQVSSVNDQVFRDLIAEKRPDLVLVNGTRIISEQTLQHIHCPIINMHVANMPKYRGVHGVYWLLFIKD